jgi:ABC-type branched-subunit amino acid transport system ATPase component
MPPTADSTGPPAAATLATDALSKDFQGVRALRDISISVAQGAIVGLIGPNGSGKTTLLNCLSGVLRPSSGSVLLDRRAVGGWPPHRMAAEGVARTFQNIRLFGGLTGSENVEVAALACGHVRRREARAHARELLAEFGIGRFADARAGALSYGDQRRLEIARALATQPRFLLLDEPAAGMNESESEALALAIKAIRTKRRCAVVLVEHDMQLVMNSSDHVYVLNEGQLISEGSPSDVQADPAVVGAYLGQEIEEEE